MKYHKMRIKPDFFLLPSLIGVGVFFVIPFLVVIAYAFVDNPVSMRFVFLDNFVSLFRNDAFQLAARNTLRFSLTAVPLAVLLSLGLALLLNAMVTSQSVLRTIFLSPMTVPVASVILIWNILFYRNGTVNAWLQMFGIAPMDWLKSAGGPFVILLLFLWKNLGYNMILFLAGLSHIPKSLCEAAQIDGAGEAQIFFSVKLRYLSSTLLFVTIMSLINSFKIFRETYLLTGDYPYESLYFLQHFMNNTFKSLDYQKLSASAIIMALFIIAVVGIIFKVENHFSKDLDG